MAYTILIEDFKEKRQLGIPSSRWQDRIKPGIKSILRLMLTMRWPSLDCLLTIDELLVCLNEL
jgi:hypothetical protein